MMRRTIVVAALALLAAGVAAWWQWGPAVFVAGMGGLIC
jgi:hypothetical protein